MLYCVSLLEKPIKKGELQGTCVFDYTLTNRFYILCFFHLVRGDSAGLWTLTLLSIHEPYCANRFHFHMRMKVCVCVCAHACICIEANTHMWWIRMGWSSELCRALTESSFEMYIQCEGLKWFLLNSIFYRFCRHFVVGRKQNKRHFMGAFLPRFSVSHIHIDRFEHFLILPNMEQFYALWINP